MRMDLANAVRITRIANNPDSARPDSCALIIMDTVVEVQESSQNAPPLLL
ncbi:hypothetical protein L3Y34_016933 [Caenorhabditis briggsae]|uniref:Uncharacterized protein n=1 Tax=Caenorhabditis briggsae TaxID=6238 RepID=A0AAE9ISB4_CAEBR|nr:hypothetical protein L3Y34_016933 [Caenorhabditis briggsae]